MALTAEAWDRARVSPCGICSGHSGSGSSSVFPVSVIPPWLPILIYHLGDEQQACWCPQFRETASPRRHEQQDNALDKHLNKLFVFL
jgi:hypothetical protein